MKIPTALNRVPVVLIVAMLAACGGGDGASTAPATAAGTNLTGTLIGTIGAAAVLQNNGGDDLNATVTQSIGGTAKYDKTAFTFATKLADAAQYLVSVKTPPTDQTCKVFAGASGTMPAAANSLWVGCELNYDQLSRSTNDSVFGSYSQSSKPMLGGSAVAVGTTTTAYGEGRYAVFLSSIAGMAGSNSGNFVQVFWRDRYAGITLLVSATAAGVEGNGSSSAPVISADGQMVAFESAATNLVTGDNNATNDIFVWSALNPGAGVTRVSVGANGAEANGGSHNPSVSGDGKVVAFESTATNLVASPVLTGTATTYIYRRDLVSGANKLISVNAAGQGQSGNLPALSEDGKRLVFETFSSLLASDTNNLWDIYLYDDTSGLLTRVSLTSTGAERDQGTESSSRIVAPAISGNGRYVAYSTTATNVVPGDTNTFQDVFVVDTQPASGTVMPVVRASVGTAGAQGDGNSPVGQGERLSLSYDGQWVAFTSSATNLGTSAMTGTNAFMHNISTGETRPLTVSSSFGPSGPVSMSRTGAYVAFWAGTVLDPRFNASGLFARYTGVTNAFSWVAN